jgi:hypothetical protein
MVSPGAGNCSLTARLEILFQQIVIHPRPVIEPFNSKHAVGIEFHILKNPNLLTKSHGSCSADW